MQKRLKIAYVTVIVLLALLAVKLAYIQIYNNEDYSQAMVSQYKVNLEGSDERGTIYDRNMEPLTGCKKEYVYILEKEKLDATVYSIFKTIDARKVPSQNKSYAVFSSSKYNRKNSKNLIENYNAIILETVKRYDKEQTAVHLLGHINEIDDKGAAGIEKDYDEFLTKRSKEIFGVADAAGNLIPGQGVTAIEENKDSGIITTLDKSIQEAVEAVLKKNKINGAIVVADVETGGVLSSACWPIYNPNSVDKYLNSGDKELINRATQGLYPPGSVFKIIISAAVLEENVADLGTVFTCKGYEIINGVKINCNKQEGHGTINFKDAFAKSCNSVFIQLGQKIGGEKILSMAKKFKLNDLALPDISNENKGVLPQKKDVLGAGIGNLSIGQGMLLLTPIGVARSTMIIANDGTDKGLYIIKGAKDNGETKSFEKRISETVIRKETSEKIAEMMKETAESGTARALKITDKRGEPILAAVKTGSAEASVDGEYAVHGWITGFLPAENPRYVITVFAEAGGSGKSKAQIMFEQTAKKLP